MKEPRIKIQAGLAGRKSDEMVVGSDDAGPIIDRLIVQFDKTLNPLDNGHNSHAETQGAVGIVSERAGQSRGFDNRDAAARRLYDLREQNSSSVSLDWYEAYLIAMDYHLGQFDVPIFPAGQVAAKDMVDVHAEELSEFEQAKLARSLWNFTRGYFAAINHEKRLDDWREEVKRANLLDNFAPVELPTSRWYAMKKKAA